MNLNQFLECIKNGLVYDIGMSADMFWISIENHRQYAIDIQSPFRIIMNNKIVLSNMDLYLAKEIFEEKNNKCKSFFPCKIIDIYITSNNDLNILLENNIKIETFTNSSSEDDEQWRIFERHNEKAPHYVAYFNEVCDE